MTWSKKPRTIARRHICNEESDSITYKELTRYKLDSYEDWSDAFSFMNENEDDEQILIVSNIDTFDMLIAYF